MKRAVVLLSGGLDSATVLAFAKAKKYKIYAISFDYGQRHKIELSFAKTLAKKYAVKKHIISKISLRDFSGSALTSPIKVPKNRKITSKKNDIPVTYVPARNTIFLSLALAFAESVAANHIFIGVNALDYSGYPDCRSEYIKSFEKMANLATKAGVNGNKIKIHTPLIKLSKAEIIKLGLSLGVEYNQTLSCYDPVKNKPCGACDSCQLRKKGFIESGIVGF